jgi:hypothetical protein
MLLQKNVSLGESLPPTLADASRVLGNRRPCGAQAAVTPFVPDDPRLLARSSTKGYTDFPGRALRSGPHGADIEPEAIPEELQREYSAEPRRRWEVVKADELARKASRSRCGRLKKVDQDARKRGVDIHRHLAAIEREISLAEQLVNPAT